MKKKSVIIGAIISTTVALFLLVTAVAVPSVNVSNNDCIDIDCLNLNESAKKAQHLHTWTYSKVY
jgi:hypothetical protein